jgi:hypothetical protein
LESFSGREQNLMKVNKIIQKRMRRSGDGINVVADVSVALTGNVGEGGTSRSKVVSRQSIVQRSSKKTARSEQSSSVEVDRDGE